MWEALWHWLQTWGTLLVAAWGAATGTAALILNWLLAARDRGTLRVVAWLEADDAVPPHLSLKATVTNTGRRQVRFSEYALERPVVTFLPVALPPWRVVHQAKKDRQVVLDESQEETLWFDLGTEVLRQSRRFRIIDTVGRSWHATRRLNGAKVIKGNTVEPLELLELGRKGEPGAAHVALFPPRETGSPYRLQGRFYGRESRFTMTRFHDVDDALAGFGRAAAFAR